MKARLAGQSIGSDGKLLITLTPLGDDFWAEYKVLKDRGLAEIKPLHRKRSLDANAYAWVLIDKLAQATGIRKDEIYREAIRNIGGTSTTVCVLDKAIPKLCESWRRNGLGWQTEIAPSKIDGCMNVVLYYGSSIYDTAQMSRLIDLLIQDCKQLGIETMPPHELAALEERWR